MPWRVSTFETVEWAWPGGAGDEPWPPAGVAAAVADALLQLDIEQPRIRRGRLERSNSQLLDESSCSLAPSLRCHQR